jgi:hypothetical protein
VPNILKKGDIQYSEILGELRRKDGWFSNETTASSPVTKQYFLYSVISSYNCVNPLILHSVK